MLNAFLLKLLLILYTYNIFGYNAFLMNELYRFSCMYSLRKKKSSMYPRFHQTQHSNLDMLILSSARMRELNYQPEADLYDSSVTHRIKFVLKTLFCTPMGWKFDFNRFSRSAYTVDATSTPPIEHTFDWMPYRAPQCGGNVGVNRTSRFAVMQPHRYPMATTIHNSATIYVPLNI